MLITGCDSGFGYDAALELALHRGFTVYAGCLTENGMAALAARAKAAALEVEEGGNGKAAGRRIGAFDGWWRGVSMCCATGRPTPRHRNPNDRPTDQHPKSQPTPGKLIPLQLDVTKAEHMDAAFARVERECGGRLFAVVNNAGVGLAGMVDWMPEDHFRFVMEVRRVVEGWIMGSRFVYYLFMCVWGGCFDWIGMYI